VNNIKIAMVSLAALALAACSVTDATTSLLSGGLNPVASVQNPVTTKQLYQAENTLTVAATALVAYRRSCLRGDIDQKCRAIVAGIQKYTRPAQAAIVSLRGFLRSNDQVNAVKVYNELRDLIASVQSTMSANNIGGN
jgi:hypothetical protein